MIITSRGVDNSAFPAPAYFRRARPTLTMSDSGEPRKRSRFDQTEPDPPRRSRFDRRSRSPPARGPEPAARGRSPLPESKPVDESAAPPVLDPAAAAGRFTVVASNPKFLFANLLTQPSSRRCCQDPGTARGAQGRRRRPAAARQCPPEQIRCHQGDDVIQYDSAHQQRDVCRGRRLHQGH